MSDRGEVQMRGKEKAIRVFQIATAKIGADTMITAI
jgi:hypothetical protein